MARSQALAREAAQIPTLRLITDLNGTLTHHCPLCHFFHDANAPHCPRRRRPRAAHPPPSLRHSDIMDSSADASSAMPTTVSIKAKIKTQRRPDSPTLRHKQSPTEISLRELRKLHSRQAAELRRSSDERLREMYEAQIVWYLGGEYVTLDRVEE